MATIIVNGMHCKSCSALIREELEELGATDITIEVNDAKQKGTVNFKTNKDMAEIKAAIEALGDYTVAR